MNNKRYGKGFSLRFAVALLVLALHAALIYALWRAHPKALSEQSLPVFVRILEAAPAPFLKALPLKKNTVATASPVASKHDAAAASTPPVLINHLPEEMSAETLAQSPLALPGTDTRVPSTPAQVAPSIGIASGLSLSCPVRTAPLYPTLARKLGEAGNVLLRVELDETGQVVSVDIAHSSGFSRLDAAALAAVKNWRCNPAIREGQAVRAVSLESFDFELRTEAQSVLP